MKRQHTNWEKIFANDVTHKELIFKIYKQLIQLNIKTKTNKQKKPLKNGHKTWIDIFAKKRYGWPTVTWKEARTTLLIIKEMQIKTTMRNHLISVRMALIRKTSNNEGWWGCALQSTWCVKSSERQTKPYFCLCCPALSTHSQRWSCCQYSGPCSCSWTEGTLGNPHLCLLCWDSGDSFTMIYVTIDFYLQLIIV